MFETTVRVKGVKETMAALKEIEPEALSALRKELRVSIQPIANRIASNVPNAEPRLKGFRENLRGRADWSQPKAKVSFTPGTKRRFRDTHPLVSITLDGSGGKVGFNYAELAGIKRHPPRERSRPFTHWRTGPGTTYRYAGQGMHFIEALNRAFPSTWKAGRFAYKAFIGEKKAVGVLALDILDKYAAKVSRKLERD